MQSSLKINVISNGCLLLISVENLLALKGDGAAAFLLKALEKETLVVKHPKLGISTYARSSQIAGMANVIHFSDIELQNHWYLIQIEQLMDGYYVDGLLVNPRDMVFVNYAKKVIDSGELEFNLKDTSSRVDGLIFSQRRPYHFFYDQYVNYFKLSSLQDINKYCFASESCFNSEVAGYKFEKIKAKGCYLYPCLPPRDYKNAATKAMHYFLKNNSEEIVFHSDLTIWLGITGQKRSWIEQVDGYIEIIKKLAMKFKSLTVLIDGWTNFENDNSETVEVA